MDSGDVIRAKQQPTEELQRTEEYTKADKRSETKKEVEDRDIGRAAPCIPRS